MKKLIIAAALVFTLATGLFANGLENKNAIGVYVIGSEQAVGGIQYERRFTDLISTKFGVFAFYNDDTYSDPFNMNFTVETDFTLFENNWRDKICSRLFAYAMVGYIGFMERSWQYAEPESTKVEKMHNNAAASAGFGFDFIFFEHLSVPVQFGFMGTFPDDPQVGFCGGIGLRYSW
jgi:hypothetical protein